jgi:hypothetical protein
MDLPVFNTPLVPCPQAATVNCVAATNAWAKSWLPRGNCVTPSEGGNYLLAIAASSPAMAYRMLAFAAGWIACYQQEHNLPPNVTTIALP